MKNFKTLALTAATTLMMSSNISFASGCDLFSSGGFIANAAECAAGEDSSVGQAAQVIDQFNGQTGRPIDNMIYSGVDYFAPGVGTAMGEYAEYQNNGGFQQFDEGYSQQQQYYNYGGYN